MSKAPSTPATRLLRERKLAYTEHLYRYQERGGTAVSARELGVDEHAVVKTLVMVERTVLDLPLIYVNGGSRGFLVGVEPRALAALLSATPVDAAIEG